MPARGEKRKRNEFGQQVARAAIRAQLEAQGVSLRWLAKRIGLCGHGSLSRFLTGRAHLPFETLLDICRELGIEGGPLQNVIDALALPALPPVRRAASRREIVARGAGENARVRDVRFFLNERVPYVYDTLRLLRQGTPAEIAAAMHRRWKFRAEEIAVCLEGLARLRLVERAGEVWRVIDASRDIVMPSKHSTTVGLRVVRHALSMQQAFLDEPPETRLIRSILTSLRVPGEHGWREALATKFAAWQDELLALQGPEDDTVLNVVLGVTEVARKRGSLR